MELSSDTTDLLRPNQVSEMREEIATLENMLNAPPHIKAQITDRGMMRKRCDRLKKDMEKYTPRAYSEGERDAAVKEFEGLSEAIQSGMPSSEEMRRNPPGAVGKQIDWQKRTKKAVARYKHIAMRLLAGGDTPARLKYAGDAANIELLRPLRTSHDVAMDGAQIPQKTGYHIGADPVGAVVFSDAEVAALRSVRPELADSLAVLDNEKRSAIKDALTRALGSADDVAPEPPAVPVAAKPEPKDLAFNTLRSMAFKAGIVGARKMKRIDLITALRARHLIA